MTTMTAEQAAHAAQIASNIADAIGELQALPNDGTKVYGWDYGLAVKYNDNGTVCPLSYDKATVVRVGERRNEVRNGAGVAAKVLDRWTVAQKQIASLENCLAMIGQSTRVEDVQAALAD